ncbi:carboxypeptidase regulatory-like domain-containing protein [Hymenobacter sp. GOD-10R]|uniref:carboxypeptidase regulatory-like domain-containing protein n=1 Tax=Hymenobacter sp. GOD-10R TaxID=3093922 RepID=UPI002D778A6B|nr:carboxypeptidase regulatory-like domain-containing protein [Hymenobacter sp. GOD-10R]WRQ26551.1 carboxypeptidase regulatory-like domain-containing protein [Hymenobacter sp. GOD-10R]
MKTSFVNRILFGVILLLTGLQLSAATFYNGTLTGTLLDADTHEPIPYANVVLLRASDNAYVRSVKTNADGSFSLDKVTFGKYKFTTTVLGYQPVEPTITFNGLNTRVALGSVIMQPANALLASKPTTTPATASYQASTMLARN